MSDELFKHQVVVTLTSNESKPRFKNIYMCYQILPMVSLEFFIDIILPALGLTHPLTEMSTRNISWG